MTTETDEDRFMPIPVDELGKTEELRRAFFAERGIPENLIGHTIRIILAEYGVIEQVCATTITGYHFDLARNKVRLDLPPNVMTGTGYGPICNLETASPEEEFGETGWMARVRTMQVERNNRMLLALVESFSCFMRAYAEGDHQAMQAYVEADEKRSVDMGVIDDHQRRGFRDSEVEEIGAAHGTDYFYEIAPLTDDQITEDTFPYQVHVIFD